MLGTAAALVLSAGGPCFYGLLYPYRPDPYEPLMAYLHEADQLYRVRALDLARIGSGSSSSAGGFIPARAISATPSMHVAIAMLNMLLALAGRTHPRHRGDAVPHPDPGLYRPFSAGIYAVDGYLSMMAVR